MKTTCTCVFFVFFVTLTPPLYWRFDFLSFLLVTQANLCRFTYESKTSEIKIYFFVALFEEFLSKLNMVVAFTLLIFQRE